MARDKMGNPGCVKAYDIGHNYIGQQTFGINDIGHNETTKIYYLTKRAD